MALAIDIEDGEFEWSIQRRSVSRIQSEKKVYL
jgi:hypothetical protein